MLGNPKIEKLFDTAMTTMEAENNDEAYIGTMMLVVEVRTGDGETAFYTFCTDPRKWIQEGLIREADAAVTFAEVDTDGD